MIAAVDVDLLAVVFVCVDLGYHIACDRSVSVRVWLAMVLALGVFL